MSTTEGIARYQTHNLLRIQRRWPRDSTAHAAAQREATGFEKTRGTLRTWFRLILLMGQNKHGISMLQAQRLLGIGSYQTIWTMRHKIRTAMAHRDSRYKLACLIELDDALFGRKRIEGEPRRKPRDPKTVRVAVRTDGGTPFRALEDLGFKHDPHPQRTLREMDLFLPGLSSFDLPQTTH